MNRPRSAKTISLWLGLLLAAAPLAANAQTEILQPHIDAIKDFFQSLDAAAQTCLEGSAANADCNNFSEAINSDALSRYQQHCLPLTQWRDALVAGPDQSSFPDPDIEVLQTLLDVEFTCGQDALIKQTQFVLAAFQKTQTTRLDGQQTANLIVNQQRSLQTYQSLRNSTGVGNASQQQRLNQEIQQQWQRLELENLRQQTRQPIDTGSILQ